MHKWIFAAALACGWVTSPQAEPRYFLPELVQIVRVPAGDTLNVRAEPSVRAADLGDLKNGDTVEILEVQGKWARILWREANGWISQSYTAPLVRPTLSSGLPVGLSCSGTEPFWSAKLFKLGSLYLNGASLPITKSGVSQNTTVGYYFSAPEITGILYRVTCGDGMSDRDYGWKLDLVTPQGMLSGCCTGDKF